MAYQQYGTTWWGQKWLDSLKGIDFSNRIPRGLSYARNDRVFGVKIDKDKGTIVARVVGNYTPYYTVTLQFERVSEEKKTEFIDTAVRDLSVISKLTNRELDPKLCDIADQCGIKLFPTSWKDIDMRCTCPDWAVPCKHIAAVIYTVSVLIDANPELIFDLIGIDLKAEFEARHLFDDDDTSEKWETPSFDRLYHEALITPNQLKSIAAEQHFDLNLVAVSNEDAQLLYRAPNLIVYNQDEIILDPKLRNNMSSLSVVQNKAQNSLEALMEQRQEVATLQAKMQSKDDDLKNLERMCQMINNKPGRRSPRDNAILSLYENSQKELQNLKDDLLAEIKKSDLLQADYDNAMSEVERIQQQNQGSIENYVQCLQDQLILGYDVETEAATLKAEAEAAAAAQATADQYAANAAANAQLISDLDAIDSGDDVDIEAETEAKSAVQVQEAAVVASVEEPAKPKKRGRKSKAEKEAEAAAAAAAATAAAATAAAATAAAATAATAANEPLKPSDAAMVQISTGEVLQMRRYQGSLEALENLTYVPVPDLGDSIISLFTENSAGFTKGKLRARVATYIDKAAAMAAAQLKERTDRDFVSFDFESTKDAIAASVELAATARPSPKLRSRAALDVGQGLCAKQFSRDAICDQGYFAHLPLFYLNQQGMLVQNVPFNVTVYARSAERHSVLTMMPPKSSRVSQDNSFSSGLYDMFSGFIKNTNVLNEQSSEINILYCLWFIASNLVRSRAVMPQLYLNYEGKMQCRWIPATVSTEIRDLVTKVGLALQGYEHFLFNRLDRQYYLNPLFLGEVALSTFIQSYLSWAFEDTSHGDADIDDLKVLFKGESAARDSMEIDEQGLCYRLENWMAPLNTRNLNYIPVLRFIDLGVEEDYEDTIFADLEDEINESAKDTASLMDDNIAEFVTSGKRNILMDDDEADDAADNAADNETGIGEEEDKAFANSRGVGMELGFMGFPSEIMDELEECGFVDSTGFVPLRHIIAENSFETMRQECLRTLSRLSSLAPSLNRVFDTKYNVAVIPLEELYSTISTAQKALQLIGVRLVIPKSLRKFLNPSSAMKLDVSDTNVKSFVDLQALMSFTWQLAIGERPITSNEFNMLMANAGQIVRFNDSFVYADPDLLRKIQDKYNSLKSKKPDGCDILTALLTGEFEDSEVLVSEELKATLKSLLKEKKVDLPKGLNPEIQLRPYQVRGYEWLLRNADIKVGSILADDMGLGKTLQVITAMLKLKEDGQLTPERPALVVVPTTLLTNWEHEINKFAPDQFKVFTYYGGARVEIDKVEADIILTTYGTARSRIKDLTSREYSLLVIDEAQAIKSIRTAVNKALREVKADSFIAMSGTPVENRLLEYFSILDFVNRGLFGSAERFKTDFARPIELNHDADAVGRFKRLTAPFIMRRLKTDKSVIRDLPEKVITDQYCTLTPNQVALYQAVVESKMKVISECTGPESSNIRRALVLSMIQDLKSVCNSPSQYQPKNPKYSPEDSGKVERLYELLSDITDANGKALIFTQSVVMGKFLQDLIAKKFQRKPNFLYGALSRTERASMVDQFQNDNTDRFLLLSLRAAGTGLTLTAANHVIHYDLWWNPAVENQATDRAYRIGQKQAVQVYRFICANTFEERINAMINSKRDLADMTVVTGESWIGNMSNRQLTDLFSLHES